MAQSNSSLASLFHHRISVSSERRALLRKVDGNWQSLTFRDLECKVFDVVRLLQKYGVERGDRVALLAQTSPEWAYFDFALLTLGAITVPIYPSVTADEVFYILNDSGAKLLLVEDANQRGKIKPLLDRLPSLRQCITLEKTSSENFVALEQLNTDLAAASAVELKRWREQALTISASDVATIVYTSGTTGQPKGAELTHANFLAAMDLSIESLALRPDDLTLLFLPTAHILGRLEQMLILGVGWSTAFAEGFAGLMENMNEVKPTMLVSVPRIYEKFYAAIQSKFSSGSRKNKRVFEAALAIGREYSQCLQKGRNASLWLRARYALADRLVFSKVRERFGGRLRFTISGGAPLSAEIAEFFHACGILILEGYGLTETTGPLAVNRPGRFQFGSTGLPGAAMDVRIASDGEILVKGPTIFKGYHGKQTLTGESMVDGYLMTGDIGVIDSDGFLRITDRKKDLIVTAAGKNIAPQKIENLIKGDALFSNAVVFGDKQKFVVALLSLNVPELRRVVSEKGIAFKGVEESAVDPQVRSIIRSRFDATNEALASYERVKKFKILSRDLSIEAGELTPSLKVKRKFCAQKYAPLIEEMYRS